MTQFKFATFLLLSSTLLFPACAGSRQNPPSEGIPSHDTILTFLPPLEQVKTNFIARQKLSGKFRDQEFQGEVIVQKLFGELTIIALTPFGSKAFVIKQTKDRIEATSLMPQELFFPFEFMVLAIHRSLFIGHGKAEKLQHIDGKISFFYKGIRIHEIWREGKLIERHFFTKQEPSTLEFSIHYGEGMKGIILPPQIDMIDHRIGYQIQVQTVQFQQLF